MSLATPTTGNVYAEEHSKSNKTTFDHIRYIQCLFHFKSLEKQYAALDSERGNYPKDSQEYKELSEQLSRIFDQELYYEKKIKVLYYK
jgi:hypothetical protein